jgi:hypothetical protein
MPALRSFQIDSFVEKSYSWSWVLIAIGASWLCSLDVINTQRYILQVTEKVARRCSTVSGSLR